MTNSASQQSNVSPFDRIRHEEDGFEYWSARELQPELGYSKWQDFENAVDRARISCKVHGLEPANHFMDTHKMVTIGSDAQRAIKDYRLTRYACYLVAMNGDVTKAEIANAQAYFLESARLHELSKYKQIPSSTEKELHFDQGLIRLFGPYTSEELRQLIRFLVNMEEERLLAPQAPPVSKTVEPATTAIAPVNDYRTRTIPRPPDDYAKKVYQALTYAATQGQLILSTAEVQNRMFARWAKIMHIETDDVYKALIVLERNRYVEHTQREAIHSPHHTIDEWRLTGKTL